VRPLTLEEAGELPASRVGGKALGLARLVALGLPVPPAVVLDVSWHEAFLAGERTVPEPALEWPLAVRSSAADEDAADKSAAGQYESVMNVGDADALRAAIEHCYRAADSARAVAYRGDGATARVALVLQRSIAAQRAGVAFSVDPVTGAEDDVVVEAVLGHGEGLVSGALDPDRYRVARRGGGVRARRAEKPATGERRWARVLRDDEARRVAELTLAAEAGTGRPVDVEFCWAGQELWLVQCRPITALA
jgi:rifampicin phosphotransferase